ncbi:MULTISPECIES: T9SS type B sorting domain-containing protein [Flavobacterium]|uniref:T9SS type B sorting domain-containing protein n=1 Tax=Flavobacterium TaxID=237 RepID=UPI002114C4C6|nr:MULTISPECIES: choice-of-anchor L domain-containing protein [Flavobacterium]UUF13196.1 T9SS type B sorting domain-containing protein [Flavobacterium panici]
MKKILFVLLITLFSNFAKAQLVVDNTSLTPQQLAQNVLLGQGVNISNIKFNGSSSNSISDQIAVFDNGAATNIGINKGLILSTGNAIIAKGPNNSALATLPTSSPVEGDSDLSILTNNAPIKNVAVLEFDFIPVGNKLTFNFVFASDEYPEFVNDLYNDNFGFFISGPGISGPYSGNAKNIALIPNTSLPVSINNLNNGTSNAGPCEYCQYYINNENGATIQYDGFTKVIEASSDVECGQTYHIKLAIANVADNNYDSAVFIEGASFSSSGINLGEDLQICSSTNYTLKTGLDPSVIHEWTFNGIVIPSQTGPEITINQSGTYGVKATPIGIGCPVSDEIKIQFSTIAKPYLYCGTKTSNSITFDWLALGTAEFSVAYKIGNNPIVNIGYVGKIYSYTVQNVPNGETVTITVTPIGNPAECFGSNSISCILDNCVTTPTLTLNQGSASQQVCENTAISDVSYTIGGGATSASITSGNLPTGVTTSLVGNIFTISGIPTSSGTYNYTIATSGGCGSNANSSGSIIVNKKTIPLFTPINAICEGESISLPLQSTNGINGTWSPAINNLTTTEYTFTPNSGQCAVAAKLTIPVNQKINPTFNTIAPICEGETIILPTQSINGINGTWTPLLNNLTTTEYTFTPNSGQCANTAKLTVTVNQKTIPTFNSIAPICEGEAIVLPSQSNNGITGTWFPAINNLATTEYTFTPNSGQCANTAKLTVTVNQKTTPTFNTITSVCEGETIMLPLQSANGINGTWTPSLNNLATTEYTFTPSSGQCANTAKLTITVNQKTTPTFNTITSICEGETIVLPTQSINGINGTWTPALNNLATTEYTFTPNSGECAVSSKLTITVNQKTTPTFTAISPICEGETIVLPTQSMNGINGTWTPALNNLATTEYTFTPNSGECAVSSKLTIAVNQKTVPLFSIISPICESETISLPLQSNNRITGTWSPAIDNLRTTEYTFTPNNGQCEASIKVTVVVYPKPEPKIEDGKICIENISNNVVQSYLLNTQLNSSTYNFEWFLDGNKILNQSNSTLEAKEAGHYAVIAIDKNTNCISDIVEAEVTSIHTNSGEITMNQSESFSENSTITINVTNASGVFEYQIDNSGFQFSNQFTDVNPGKHTINVRSINGCTNLAKEIIVIGYPKFFTPNGDGQNDTWNIIGFEGIQNDRIFIFDRYGKLIKQLNSKNLGWDGTYNGHQMPATDYWFKILFTENKIEKEFKSHFSLKR